MKHAFLIIAHNNWWQLKKLIECLCSDTHDIYVHIDKKSNDFDKEYFADIFETSKVQFFQEYEVFWGGFSQVQVEMFLLGKAFDKHYDYYHIISGADLPLKNNQEIDDFFEKNSGKEFILYDDKALEDNPEISRRTKYYHFLQNYRRRYRQKWKNSFFTFFERILLVMQIILHINRVKNLDWQIKYGSNWVSITDKLVKIILDNNDKIANVFSCTNCADELFIQTIAYNFGFEERIYRPEQNQAANVRFIDWDRGKNGNPYTFKLEDIYILFPEVVDGKNDIEMLLSNFGRENKNLFARKFSESIDKKVINEVLMHLENKR